MSKKNIDNNIDADQINAVPLSCFYESEFLPIEGLLKVLESMQGKTIDSGYSYCLANLILSVFDTFHKNMTEGLRLIEKEIGDIRILQSTPKHLKLWPGTMLGAKFEGKNSIE